MMVFSPEPRPFGSSSIELVEMRRRERFSTLGLSIVLEPARTERTDVMEMSND
ncbi:hypothetical protein LL253_09435 [Sphingobium soli]|uniref:Uncharacterized protein n=1 Tax=Sphingobium soli TaxID=1591116 RepID=A0ABS8H3N3_9SPHN|nr:hypothetical protein [Sphingobium soli]MCC4232911.1 hypothetical protein [Sphingobium soli]